MSERHLALRLQYDGSAFHGSQRQAGQATVQETLEEAIGQLTQEAHRTAFAGRTDTGVHALGQVVAVRTRSALPLEQWIRGLNHLLPPQVAVQDAREVPPDFDPRRDARSRTYRYDWCPARNRQPLLEPRAWVFAGQVNFPALRDGAARLIGEHDFASFCAKPGNRGTVRTMDAVEVGDFVEDGVERIHLTFRGASFLHHQIRFTVGQLVRIGIGKAEPAVIDRLLQEPVIGTAGPKAPAQGLVLVRVRYDTPELADWNDDEDVRPV